MLLSVRCFFLYFFIGFSHRSTFFYFGAAEGLLSVRQVFCWTLLKPIGFDVSLRDEPAYAHEWALLFYIFVVFFTDFSFFV